MHPLAIPLPADVTACPLCGDASGRFRPRGYYVKCPTCKVAFRPEHASDAVLDEYWQEEFWSEEEIEKRKRREPVFRQAFEILRGQKPEGGSVLDIGCGIGTFLAVCREGGWDVTGVEPSGTACEVARQEYGLELINAPFSTAMFRGKKFDAVFAAQVLHHLPDPAAFAADIDRVLTDDGVLILRTPNAIAVEPSLLLQRLLGRKNGFFCGPALYVFHPETFSMLFSRLGYRDVTFVISRPYLEAPQVPWRRGQSLGPNVKRLLAGALKLTSYGTVQMAHRLSGRRALLGPSIFVVARKS